MIAFLGFMFATAVAQGPDPDAAKALSDRARQSYDAARYTEAEPLYRQALEAWDLQGPEAAQARAIDRRNLGALLRATGRYHEAEPVLVQSLGELEASGAATMEIGRALFNLSSLYRAEGNLRQAESFALRAASLIDKSPGLPARAYSARNRTTHACKPPASARWPVSVVSLACARPLANARGSESMPRRDREGAVTLTLFRRQAARHVAPRPVFW
jgi:tetratricopeptide (TPR) repeat protein